MSKAISKAEEITGVLRTEILRGQYRSGERLPSERDLAVRFDSNRGAVRESLKKLEQLGIANIGPGGVRVVPIEEATLDVLGHILNLDNTPDPRLVGQVFEVLSALMSLSARTAIESANDEELVEIESIVQRMINHAGDAHASQQDWKDLGLTLTRINENLVLRLILNGLKTQFVGRMPTENRSVNVEPVKHREILERMRRGVAARDARCVANSINDHFTLIREAVSSALEPVSPVPQERSLAGE
jgi:GntR family transcriptional repressor for pyruvate dehydrogenase complex